MPNFDKYIGIKFAYQGRSFDGVDCFGIPFLMFQKERGIELPDFLDLKYGVNWTKKDERHILENINEIWEVIKDNKFKRYDLHLFKDENDILSHVGINIGHSKFIHIFEGKESIVSRLSLWRPRLHSTIRYRENG